MNRLEKSSNLETKSRTRNWCGKKAHLLIGTPKSTLQYGQSGICDLTFSIFPKLWCSFGFQKILFSNSFLDNDDEDEVLYHPYDGPYLEGIDYTV